MTRRIPELLAGFAVIIVAILFLLYALRGAGEVSAGGYTLKAQFGSIGGLTVGSSVKIGGVVIGHVSAETLNPITYAAEVTMDINKQIKIPTDSSASVTSDGLLGGPFVSISPGGANSMMKPGGHFQVTQSAINLEDLIGKFIFSMGGGSHSQTPAHDASNAAPPANPALLPQ